MEENVNNYYQLIFKRLFTISAALLNEYKQLEDLEKNNQKNSAEYIIHYQKFQEYKTKEESIYETLSTQPEIINSLLKKVAYFNKRATDFIVPTNTNNLIYTRISLKLGNCLSNFNKNKSPEVFALFNKFDIFSLMHFESIILALILFKQYCSEYPNSILNNILLSNLYSYSFMFPYVEDNIKNNFTIPDNLYSATEWFISNTIVDQETITKFRSKKFDQVKNYMSKNSLNSLNYIFLLFYLKALDPEKTKEIDTLIKKSGLQKDTRHTLKEFIVSLDTTKLVRKISFAI